MDRGLTDKSTLKYELRMLEQHRQKEIPAETPQGSKSAVRHSALGVSTPKATSVRDLVTQVAHKHGILFAPKIGRTTALGQPLYSFGNATLYIDQGVVYVRQRANTFAPISVEELPEVANI